MTKQQRQEVEELILQVFDTVDRSKINSNYYRELFSTMNDTQFYNWMKKDFPIKFQMRPSVTEPDMTDIENALKIIGVPLIEKVSLPYLYTNKEGKAVNTQDCLVVYTHLKKVQQFITKKNKYGTDITNRDIRTGRLIGQDKGAGTSDREFESLATLGLDYTMDEFSRPRADAMEAKNAMYNSIATTGMVRLEELPKSQDDSLSKNLMNSYLIGCHINTNLINKDGYTAYTLRKKKNVITR